MKTRTNSRWNRKNAASQKMLEGLESRTLCSVTPVAGSLNPNHLLNSAFHSVIAVKPAAATLSVKQSKATAHINVIRVPEVVASPAAPILPMAYPKLAPAQAAAGK